MYRVELAAEIERLGRRVEKLRSSGRGEGTVEDLVSGLDALRTAHAELQAQREAMELLREEVRRKNEFLAMLGHELRNPLAAILLATDLLIEGEDPQSRRAGVAQVVRRQAEQLGRLVDDLLEIARTRHGKLALRLERVDLRRAVSAAIESGRPLLEHNRHAVRALLPADPVWVKGDPARLHQVLANLLDNAAKYTPPGGHVEVRLCREDATATLSVVDDGIGIAGDKLETIFGVFEQASPPGEAQRGGLGLGLALVKLMVELHGGTVRAASAGHGCGSEFSVTLPLLEAAVESGEEDARRPHDATSGQSTVVLIVDDNQDAAEMLGMSLGQLGYDSIVASSGHQALERAHHAGCRVALVDLGLPDISGFELARRLRAQHPDIVLVALTGFGNDRSRSQAEQAGFLHYLLKPAPISDICRIVEDATRPPR